MTDTATLHSQSRVATILIPGSVINALSRAKDRIASKYDPNDEDEYWAVIDKDQWDLESAAKQIRQKQFCLAESYPCFELWLLLHHMTK